MAYRRPTALAPRRERRALLRTQIKLSARLEKAMADARTLEDDWTAEFVRRADPASEALSLTDPLVRELLADALEARNRITKEALRRVRATDESSVSTVSLRPER